MVLCASAAIPLSLSAVCGVCVRTVWVSLWYAPETMTTCWTQYIHQYSYCLPICFFSSYSLSLSLIRSYFDCDVMRYGISSAPHWRLLSLSLCVIDAKNSVAIHNTRHRLCQSAHRQSNRIQNIGSQWSLQIQWNFDAFFGSNAILHDALLFLISCLSPIWLVVFECALILATQSAVQRMLSIGWIAVSCRSSRQLLSNSAHTTNW